MTAKSNVTIKCERSNKLLMSNLAARYKFMHLLSAKASTKVMAPKHSYFKCKSLKSKVTKTATKTTITTTPDTTNSCENLADSSITTAQEIRPRTTSICNTGCGGGVGGSLAKASKLKLKMGFTKTNSKLKWTRKFHWLQNYVRSADATAELRKNFVQSTSTQRLNSNSSSNSNYNNNINGKTTNITTATTTTTTAITIANNKSNEAANDNDDIIKTKNLNINSNSLLQLNYNSSALATSNVAQMPLLSSANMLEDYYSSICDNQLSFNNSPCKSPRSLMDDTITTVIQQQQQQHNEFVKNINSSHEKMKQLLHIPSGSSNTNLIVVAAARPANLQAIGFNVSNNQHTIIPITNGGSTVITANSGSSIYDTPSTSFGDDNDDNDNDDEKRRQHQTKNSPFVFPSISAEITELAHVLKATTTTTITTTNHSQQQQQQHYVTATTKTTTSTNVVGSHSLGNGSIKTYDATATTDDATS